MESTITIIIDEANIALTVDDDTSEAKKNEVKAALTNRKGNDKISLFTV